MSTCCCCCWVTKSCPTFCNPMDCSPPGSSVHADFPSQKPGVGCYFLLPGIFPSQGSTPRLLHLLHWQVDSFLLSHWGGSIARCTCICIFWFQIHFTFPQYLTKQNNHLLLSTFSNNSQPTLTSLYFTQVASKCFATILESFVLYSIQIIDCLLISLVYVSYIYS